MGAGGASRECQDGSSRRGRGRMLDSSRGRRWDGPDRWKGSAADGRPGLCRAVDRRLSGARADVARIGEVVSGTGVLANGVGGVLGLLLIGYLVVALIRPAK